LTVKFHSRYVEPLMRRSRKFRSSRSRKILDARSRSRTFYFRLRNAETNRNIRRRSLPWVGQL